MRLIAHPVERWYAQTATRVRLDLSTATLPPLDLQALGLPEALGLGYGAAEGAPDLIDAVRLLHPGARPEQVLITHGAAEALHLVGLVLGQGRWAVQTPNYPSLWLSAAMAGATVLPWDGHGLPPEAEVVAINTPHNPTGRVFSAEELEALAALAERRGSWLLSDEVFRDLSPLGGPTPSAWGLPRAICVGSASKMLALPGLRIGWLVGPVEIVRACRQLRDTVSIAPPRPSEALALRALERREAILTDSRARLREGRAILADWLERQAGRWEWALPQAGPAAFPRLWGLLDSVAFAEALLEATGVLVLPGALMGQEGHVRLGFAANGLAEGLAAIERFLVRWDPTAER